MLTDLGKLIRRWRILRRDVLFNMAKALDMQTHELSAIENGRKEPSALDLHKIACYMADLDWKKIKEPEPLDALLKRIHPKR